MSAKTVNPFILPLVSVVITSYNQSATISQTIVSILSQKCDFPFEIIIGDDYSDDGTQEICTEFQNHFPDIIHTIFHEKNIGVAANWILSIKQARGKYIAACAADDYWSVNSKLQMQADILENNADIGLCYTDFDVLISESNKSIIKRNFLKNKNYPGYEGNNLLLDIFNGRVQIATHTVLFKKELFDKYVPVNDYIKFKFPIEDWPTWLILSKYCYFKYLAQSTAVYRKGHESLSNPRQYEQIEIKYAAEQKMYQYLCNMFPGDISYSEIGYLNYVNGILLNLAYKKLDFYAAKKYAQKQKDLGSFNPKIKMTKTKLTFYILALVKRLKQNLSY
jgi:glycosyltransferase involved in cell wall biosynthesis